MDAKHIEEMPVGKRPFKLRLFDIIRHRPFTFLPLYAAAAIGIAYGVSKIYKIGLPSVMMTGGQTIEKTAEPSLVVIVRPDSDNWKKVAEEKLTSSVIVLPESPQLKKELEAIPSKTVIVEPGVVNIENELRNG